MDPAFLKAVTQSSHASPEGATSRNRGGFIDVEYQRATDRAIPEAIVTQNAAPLATSFNIINYTFAHQRSDGGFENANKNLFVNVHGRPTPWGEAAPVAFFLEDLGHTLLLLGESSWFQHSDATRGYRQQLADLRPKVERALNWLMGQQAALKTDVGATNRSFMYGDAYYFLGKALSRSDAMAVGTGFARDAISHQLPDGTFPELGGFDSSYQGVSLYLAELLLLQSNANDRSALWSAIQRGMARETTNLLPSGEVRTQGNTRIYGVTGGRQRIDAVDVNLAFQYFAGMTQDPVAIRNAALVFKKYPSY